METPLVVALITAVVALITSVANIGVTIYQGKLTREDKSKDRLFEIKIELIVKIYRCLEWAEHFNTEFSREHPGYNLQELMPEIKLLLPKNVVEECEELIWSLYGVDSLLEEASNRYPDEKMGLYENSAVIKALQKLRTLLQEELQKAS